MGEAVPAAADVEGSSSARGHGIRKISRLKNSLGSDKGLTQHQADP